MMTALPDILAHSEVRVRYGVNSLSAIGREACDLGATRILLVSDPGILATGHVHRATEFLRESGLEVTIFTGVEENPTTDHVAAGVSVARDMGVDFIIGLGGGSSMDCAKGINFLLTNGGRMQDYWGVGKASKPLLPMIAIPTTAGTGSEAQSFALITDPATHQKMACGDKKALCKLAILDPALTQTMPRAVAAATGVDAISHAVETSACNKRTDLSRRFSKDAWQRLSNHFESSLNHPDDDAARGEMLLGANLAGCAIEQSMLGAAHACANPLTARFGIVHGHAVGVMLPHVVRYNVEHAETNPYSDLHDDGAALADRLVSLFAAANVPSRLRDMNVTVESMHGMAEMAAKQWTAQFNPVPVDADALLDIYQAAY